MRRKVVILGGGFGGAYCAQALARRLRVPEVEITLVDRHNYFVFYPMLVEAGTGSLEPRHVVVPLRSFLRPHARFRMAEVIDVDLHRRRVELRGPLDRGTSRIAYDHLVLALGSATRLPGLAGLREHGFQLKSLSDAVALRDRAVQVLEAASQARDDRRRRSLLHFVVVGGNFNGVEVAGEYQTFLRDAARRYPGLDPNECQVSLVEIQDRILGALGERLAGFARRNLERRGIEIRLRSALKEVGPDHALLRDGTRLETSTVIWCAGIAPHPLQLGLDLPRDDQGYLLCDRDLRVTGSDHLWGIGDCAVNPDPRGRPYPATAQHAVRQGIDAARNIQRALTGQAPRPHTHRSLGSIAALGCRTGVARILGVQIAGFPAWWAYRTVYLLKMPGLARKVRVAIDWTLDLLFRRDVVQLGLHHRPDSRDDPRARASGKE
jgi:NADH dehydrogenase